MRAALRAVVAATTAIVLVTGTSLPLDARTPPAPAVAVRILDATCNPGGRPGLRVTASATATGATLRSAGLFVGEFQPVSDPAFAPFPWTGSTLANWQSDDAWRRGVAADTRTLDTTDPKTFDKWNHALDLWSASRDDSWWFVGYSATASADPVAARWYVSCPAGTHVDGDTLREIKYVEEAGLR